MTHILMSWFKESTDRRKTSFLKETVENADLHKAVLNKTMTNQEWCIKYDFVATAALKRSLNTLTLEYLTRKLNQQLV